MMQPPTSSRGQHPEYQPLHLLLKSEKAYVMTRPMWIKSNAKARPAIVMSGWYEGTIVVVLSTPVITYHKVGMSPSWRLYVRVLLPDGQVDTLQLARFDRQPWPVVFTPVVV